MSIPKMLRSTSHIKDLCLLISSIFIFCLLLFHRTPPPDLIPIRISPPTATRTATALRHLVFSIASSSDSFAKRQPYLRLWYRPNSTRAFVFLDRPTRISPDPTLPPILTSADTSAFPYTYRRGLRAAVRIARIVKEVVLRNESDVRWFVFGDDDTVFFVDNLVQALSKYDHDQWYYAGSGSESYGQTAPSSFDMAFGGGGFAISHSLARALAGVLDSCLMRYPHLYGSDARVFSCVAELGVGLTVNLGFIR